DEDGIAPDHARVGRVSQGPTRQRLRDQEGRGGRHGDGARRREGRAQGDPEAQRGAVDRHVPRLRPHHLEKTRGEVMATYGYGRASTKKQVDSPETQKDSMRRYAEFNRLGEPTFFIDAATTGKLAWEERIAGRELFGRLKPG